MTSLRIVLLVALTGLFVAPLTRATAAEPAPAGKLYVTIETFEPIRFHEYRQARKHSGDLVLTTLKQTAAAAAKLAGLADEVVVLDEDAPAPADAPVLRLTWTDGRKTVTADLTENGQNHYLGVVSRKPMLDHPEHQRLLRTVTAAVLPDDKNDATVQVHTEMNLYFALKLTANHRARAAAKP